MEFMVTDEDDSAQALGANRSIADNVPRPWIHWGARVTPGAIGATFRRAGSTRLFVKTKHYRKSPAKRGVRRGSHGAAQRRLLRAALRVWEQKHRMRP